MPPRKFLRLKLFLTLGEISVGMFLSYHVSDMKHSTIVIPSNKPFRSVRHEAKADQADPAADVHFGTLFVRAKIKFVCTCRHLLSLLSKHSAIAACIANTLWSSGLPLLACVCRQPHKIFRFALLGPLMSEVATISIVDCGSDLFSRAPS